MSMRITFDTQTNELSITYKNPQPQGSDIVAALERHGRTFTSHGTRFGVTVTADGETVLDTSWPPPNTRFIKTDQDILTTVSAAWRPDQSIVVSAWCVTTLGGKVEAQKVFTSPKPPKPYPSWVWNDGWVAPIPCPDDGNWRWNEEAGQWDEEVLECE